MKYSNNARRAGFFLLLALLSCAQKLTDYPAVSTAPVVVEAGVSEALAQDRTRRISQVAYALHLTISARKLLLNMAS